MPSGGYRGELKGNGRRGPQPYLERAVTVGSARKPHEKHLPRESWWLDAENFYALAKGRDFGHFAHVHISSLTLAQQTEDRARPAKTEWTPGQERKRAELPA